MEQKSTTSCGDNMNTLKIVKRDGITHIEADGWKIQGVRSYELRDGNDEVPTLTLDIVILGDIEVDLE